MADALRPDPAKTFGAKNGWLLDTWSGFDAGLGPTIGEMTAVSVLQVTRILLPSSELPTQTTNADREDMRWGDDESYEDIGETQHTGGTLTYALNPQGATGSDGRKMYEAVPKGAIKYFVRRLAVVRNLDPAINMNVDGWKIRVGPSMVTESNPGQPNAEVVGQCRYAVRASPVLLKPIRANA